ncbi:MAG: tyrosine-type recombinase/integrase [Myxococcota bacterium]
MTKKKREGRLTRLRGVKDLGHGLYLVRARGRDSLGRRIEREQRVLAGNLRRALEVKLELETEMRRAVGGEIVRPAERKKEDHTPEVSGPLPRRRLGEIAIEWLNARLRAKRRDGSARLTKNTHSRYVHTVRTLIVPFLGDKAIDAVDRRLVERWRDHLGEHFATATVNGALSLLRAILRETECRAADTVRALENDDTRTTDDAPNLLEDEADVARLLGFFREHELEHYALVGVLVTTGLRISTALALRREDFDPEHGVITARRRLSQGELLDGVKRSRTARDVVPLVDWVWEAVRADWEKHSEVQAKSGIAFPTREGGHRARTVLVKPLQAARKALGLGRLTPHGLRRTAALLYRLRRGSAVSKAIAGHLTEEMHLHYAPVRSRERAEAGRAVFGGLFEDGSAKKGGSKGGERGDRADPPLGELGGSL